MPKREKNKTIKKRKKKGIFGVNKKKREKSMGV